MQTNELDQIHIVPLDAGTLMTALATTGLVTSSNADGGDLSAKDGDMTVLEVLEQVMGGCVVRLAPMMGDAHEMASFCEDRRQADTLIACEEAAGRIETTVLSLGGMPAGRSRGRWRPLDSIDRKRWGTVQVKANGVRLRKTA